MAPPHRCWGRERRVRGGDRIAVATDGLIVIERTPADHQHRYRRNGAATPDGPTGAAAPVAVEPTLSLPPRAWLWSERAVGDGEGATVRDSAANARTSEGRDAAAAAAAPGHVASELTIRDGGGSRVVVRDTAAHGRSRRRYRCCRRRRGLGC